MTESIREIFIENYVLGHAVSIDSFSPLKQMFLKIWLIQSLNDYKHAQELLINYDKNSCDIATHVLQGRRRTTAVVLRVNVCAQ